MRVTTFDEVYTPFPVHGLDKLLGLAPTRLAITSFIYGLVGLSGSSSHDELYYDRRLANEYWRKAKFQLYSKHACFYSHYV